MKQNIHGLTQEMLCSVLTQWGEPAFRARQIWHWLYGKHVTEWSAMANLPMALRERLAEEFNLRPVIEQRQSLAADGAGKLLLELLDGETVETAVIPADARRTVCISSQVGCAYGCAFCASGQAGFRRNLDAGEMVGQVLAAAHCLGGVPTHVVFMGVGEPLDNPEEVRKTALIVNDREGLAIGARRITVSTCGVVPGIRRMAEWPLQLELSVSLHAPDDALRSQLMPVNRKYPIDVLMTECEAFARKTKRLITFEYTLIGGVNDSESQARKLASRLQRFPARVNLIPLSSVPEFSGRRTSAAAQRRFMTILQSAGINVTVRASRGSGATAACGQLRATFRSASGGVTHVSHY